MQNYIIKWNEWGNQLYKSHHSLHDFDHHQRSGGERNDLFGAKALSFPVQCSADPRVKKLLEPFHTSGAIPAWADADGEHKLAQ